MIKISHPDLSKLAQEHYEKLKNKIKKFPTCKYSLEEVMTAEPKKLHEIAVQYKNNTSFDFMINLYNNFREQKKGYDAYELTDKLKVDVCPYCNRNYTFTVKSNNGSTRPQFDHFYDKATYPILALSFYNLIPSCPTCNSTMKGTKPFSLKTHIHPYEEGFENKAYFSLHVKDSSFYYDKKGFETSLKTEDARVQNNIRDFGLKELYDEHKEIVLELIQKAEIYNKSYLDELMQNYEGTLFKNREDLMRLVTCGYVSDDDLHKRPLSKLIKDISQELELI
jgi:hypothetical protein